MRLNQFLAKHTDLSRRSADAAIADGRVEINGIPAKLGDTVIDSDTVILDHQPVAHQLEITTIMLHKPVGYVVSKNGQGSKTIYDLLPAKYHRLNPIGRLDKDSSGLLLLTNDGELAQKLAHPKHQKNKRYTVRLDKRLSASDFEQITKTGVDINDSRKSSFRIQRVSDTTMHVVLQEGRNRQIRRTFEALGYKVLHLHRTHFGDYTLGYLKRGEFIPL